MCYDARTSKNTLIFGIIFGLILMKFGNEQYKELNKVLGIFFIFVSFMQYIEYLIWTDLECKNGNNKMAGTIGPIFNYLQPTMLFILVLIILKNNTITNEDTMPIIINMIYVLYFLYIYSNYTKGSLCSDVKDEHLQWAWRNNFAYVIYNMVMIFNILYYFNNNIGIFTFGLSYFYLILSMIKFRKHVGELWCFMATSVPFAVLAYEQLML